MWMAAKLGISRSVAVVDESGTLVYFVTGDATGLHTFETARGADVVALAAPGARVVTPTSLGSTQ